MAKIIDEKIQRQLNKKMTFFLKYFPARIRNVGEDAIEARNLIWAFKDNRKDAYEKVAQMTASHLREEYGEDLSDLALVVVPASSPEKNEGRYKAFCNRVSELTGICNGFPYIQVLNERLNWHDNRRNKKELGTQYLDFDVSWLFGRKVVVMDDIVTTGTSYALLANKLEEFGAKVLGGMFLARTHYRYGK